MQKINYKENILLEETITELLLINIDDKLVQTKESDCLIVSGKITISGEVNTLKGKKSFNHPLDVEIMLSNEQLVNDEVTISVDDFNYEIKDKLITIDLNMKIDGLKEIELYFPPQEDKEIIEVTESAPSDETLIEKEEAKETILEDTLTSAQNYQDLPTNETIKEKYSLLKQVFRNKNIKKETSYLLHVVKQETSYKEIASLYQINEEDLRKANNDEEISKGKLVFLPKN